MTIGASRSTGLWFLALNLKFDTVEKPHENRSSATAIKGTPCLLPRLKIKYRGPKMALIDRFLIYSYTTQNTEIDVNKILLLFACKIFRVYLI